MHGAALSFTMDRFHRAFSLPYLFSSSTQPANTILIHKPLPISSLGPVRFHGRPPSTLHASTQLTWTPGLLPTPRSSNPSVHHNCRDPNNGWHTSRKLEINPFTEPCRLQGSASCQESPRRDNLARSQRRQDSFAQLLSVPVKVRSVLSPPRRFIRSLVQQD